MTNKIESVYLHKVYEPKQFKKTVDETIKVVVALNKKKKINAIAFTGTSGAALAYPVSYATGIPLLCVRKSTKDNHYRAKLEGYTRPKNYIIIDDCVCTGTTIKKMVKAIKEYSPASKLSTLVLYADRYDDIERLEKAVKTKVKIVGKRYV